MICAKKKNLMALIALLLFLPLIQCISLKSKYLKLRYSESMDIPVTPDKLAYPGYDFRVFLDTPVWLLAKAIALYDIDQVEKLSEVYKQIIDTPDFFYGNSLLTISIRTRCEEAVKILLDKGANPNFKNPKNGESPMQNTGKSTLKILRMVLEKGGNPNYSTANRQSAVYNADTLEKMRMLVQSGGDIHMKNEYGGSALLDLNLTHNRLDIVLYLLNAGIDYKGQLWQIGKPNEVKIPVYLVDDLRYKAYPLDSDNYAKKMEIVKFLKVRGIDYWTTPIPKATLFKVDRIAVIEGWWDGKKKRYLEKY